MSSIVSCASLFWYDFLSALLNSYSSSYVKFAIFRLFISCAFYIHSQILRGPCLVAGWYFVSPDCQFVQCQTFMYSNLLFPPNHLCSFWTLPFVGKEYVSIVCLIMCAISSLLTLVFFCLCSHLSMVQLRIYQMGRADLLLLRILDNLVHLLPLSIILVGVLLSWQPCIVCSVLSLCSFYVFLHAGNLQGLHNIHGSYNVGNMQGTLTSRNSSMNSIPSAGVQQPNGSFSSGRFASNNLPVALSQVHVVWNFVQNNCFCS